MFAEKTIAKKKKKILYAGLFTLPDRDAAANRVQGITKILNECGYDVCMIGLSDSPIESGVRIEYKYQATPKTARDWIKLQFDCSLIMDSLKEDDSIFAVILYNYPSFSFNRIRRQCKKKGVLLIGDCTEWYHSSKDERFHILKNLETAKRMYIDNIKMDGLIVISKYLNNYYCKKQRTVQIPPVFDYNLLRCSTTTESRIKNSSKRVFIFAGTITKQKEDITRIINAAISLSKKRNDFILKIVGVKIEDYLLSNSIEKLPGNICFLGRLSHEMCITELKEADFQIFIRDSNRVNNAGFSTKFAESFSCGIPVITTNTSNLAEYLIDGETGFWVQDNIEEIMDKACSLSNKEIERMKEEVLKCDGFNFNTYISLLDKWLKDLEKD